MGVDNKRPLIIECSWEVCNQVGGIYTVIRSKVPAAIDEWGDNYCLLGPLEDDLISAQFEALSDGSDPIARAVEKMRGMGYEVWYGRWLVTGRPKVVLLNPENVYNRLEAIRRHLGKDHGILIDGNDPLQEKVILWADLVKTFFSILGKESSKLREGIIAHFHEWMASLPILDIKQTKSPVRTVFTTHATMLGRYMAGNERDFYSRLGSFDWKKEAVRYGILPQVQIERLSAQYADAFTTVSEVTATECTELLGKTPDVVTPNGLNITKYAAYHEVQNRHQLYKDKIHEFVIGHFFGSYDFDLDNTLYFFTSGRYEFRNKGYDITLKALDWLNKAMVKEGIDKTVVMFFITRRPTWSINPDVLESRGVMQEIKRNCEAIEKQVGERLFYVAASSKDEHRLPDLNNLIDDYWKLRYRRTIQSWKRKSWPIIVTHNLVDDIDDDVLNYMRELQLVNSPLDRVKVVYHPDFIESTNPLFGMDYGQFVRGCHLGVFPSYYEPWGYTPLECVARGVATVTSNLSGFGTYVESLESDHEERGVYVLDRKSVTEAKAVQNLGKSMLHFVKTSLRYRMLQRNRLEDFSEYFDWKRLLSHYKEAYQLALKK